MVANLKQSQLGVHEGDVLKLEIDPKSHSAWTGKNKNYLIKVELVSSTKKFKNFKSDNK